MTQDNYQAIKRSLHYARIEGMIKMREAIDNNESHMAGYHARYLFNIARALDAVYAEYWKLATATCFDPE